MSKNQGQSDVIIVGAGLVGLALATMLRSAGVSVSVIDKSNESFLQQADSDSRPISLNYASLQVLKTLGIDWGENGLHLQSLHVSLQSSFGSFMLTPKELNVPYLGCVLPYGQLIKSLYARAKALGVSFYFESSIDEIDMLDRGVSVHFTSSGVRDSLSASLLLAADGKQSFCRRYFNMSVDIKSNEYKSSIFHLNIAGSHQQRAYQRFTKQGTMAVIPLYEDQEVRLVFTHSVDEETPTDISAWADLFNQVYDGYLPLITEVTRAGSFPLSHYHITNPVHERCLLMGAAAYSFYPVTAQGFNSGLLDSAALAQLISVAHSQQLDIGQASLLREYVSWRIPLQERMAGAAQAVIGVFDHGQEWNVFKGLGLSMFDLALGGKSKAGKVFLGLSGRVPDLALGLPLTQ